MRFEHARVSIPITWIYKLSKNRAKIHRNVKEAKRRRRLRRQRTTTGELVLSEILETVTGDKDRE